MYFRRMHQWIINVFNRSKVLSNMFQFLWRKRIFVIVFIFFIWFLYFNWYKHNTSICVLLETKQIPSSFSNCFFFCSLFSSSNIIALFRRLHVTITCQTLLVHVQLRKIINTHTNPALKQSAIQIIHGADQNINLIQQPLNAKVHPVQADTIIQPIVHPQLDRVQVITVTVHPPLDVCQVATLTVTIHTVSKCILTIL